MAKEDGAALLEYMFLFDPTDTWQYIDHFEADLIDFFANMGLDVQVVKSINGQPGKRVMILARAERVGSIEPSGKRREKGK